MAYHTQNSGLGQAHPTTNDSRPIIPQKIIKERAPEHRLKYQLFFLLAFL